MKYQRLKSQASLLDWATPGSLSAPNHPDNFHSWNGRSTAAVSLLSTPSYPDLSNPEVIVGMSPQLKCWGQGWPLLQKQPTLLATALKNDCRDGGQVLRPASSSAILGAGTESKAGHFGRSSQLPPSDLSASKGG